MTTDGVFNAGPNPLEDLVGEGKKYKTVEELAKAYINADQFIGQLKGEVEGIRNELNTRLTVEEQLAKLQRNAEPSHSNPPANQPLTSTAPALDEETLVSRIREVANQEREAERIRQNVTEVSNKLTAVYGTPEKANEVVRQKAEELGVSIKFLEDVAAKSPKAFFAQLGIDTTTQPQTPHAPRSDVNTEALGNTSRIQPGTYAFYENLRRENPKLYWTPKVQNQLMKDAFDKGDAFYK